MSAFDPRPDGQLAQRLASALAGWLPGRRWFGGKGRPVERVDLVQVVEFVNRLEDFGPCGLSVVAEVVSGAGDGTDASPAGSGTTGRSVGYYHLPIGIRRGAVAPAGGEPITWADGKVVYDATTDPELMTALLELIAHDADKAPLRFTCESGTGADLPADAQAGLPARPLGAEQSNTSVIFGDRYLLKLFRRLSIGVNPDLEVHRRLSVPASASATPHLARLYGAIEGECRLGDREGPVTFGQLQSFVPDAVDGWELATAAVREYVDHRLRVGIPRHHRAAAVRSGNGHDTLWPRLRELGRAVAVVHQRLAEAFGAVELTAERVDEIRTTMRRRLDAAVREAPVLQPAAERLRRIFATLRIAPGERMQRVHGDLHLGQVLWTDGGWLLIDFEGEPAASVEERVRLSSPSQDVAGMLRSLDYAAGVATIDTEDAQVVELAQRWAERARAAFLQGYAGAGGTPIAGQRELLLAYELDKAVYEVVYETRNRPDWVQVPLRGLSRFAEAPPLPNVGEPV